MTLFIVIIYLTVLFGRVVCGMAYRGDASGPRMRAKGAEIIVRSPLWPYDLLRATVRSSQGVISDYKKRSQY